MVAGKTRSCRQPQNNGIHPTFWPENKLLIRPIGIVLLFLSASPVPVPHSLCSLRFIFSCCTCTFFLYYGLGKTFDFLAYTSHKKNSQEKSNKKNISLAAAAAWQEKENESENAKWKCEMKMKMHSKK